MKRVIDIVQEWRRNPDIAYDTYQPVDENIEWLEDFYFDVTDATQMREDLWIKVLERIKVLKGERE